MIDALEAKVERFAMELDLLKGGRIVVTGTSNERSSIISGRLASA